MKWAQYYSLQVDGLNIIYGLLEETEQDIIESIDNLHFFRFFKEYLNFNMSPLAITYTSKYHKELENTVLRYEWVANKQMEFLPTDYIDSQDILKIFFYTKLKRNPLWFVFEDMNKHYKISNYQYVIISNNDVIYFKELFNNLKIKEIIFDKPIYWDILKLCNYQVLSISEIVQSTKEKYPSFNVTELIDIILELKHTYLVVP